MFGIFEYEWMIDHRRTPNAVFSKPKARFNIDDAFFNRTGLERVEIVGLELELSLGWSVGSRRWTPLQKARNKEDRRGLARCLSDA